MSYQTLGERIKFHRKRLGLTQEQLAERLGVSPQAVSKWENNISCPDISILPEMADLFGITVDALLGKDGPVQEAEVVQPRQKKKFVYQNQGKIYGLWFAAYVITVGILLLVNTLCTFDVSWWTVVWTTALIFAGAAGLFPRFSIFCLILLLCGLYFLLDAYKILPFALGWNILLPVCIVLWGIGILVDVLRRRKYKKVAYRETGDNQAQREYSSQNGWIRTRMGFGSSRTPVVTDCLRGGSVEANFGDFTVDFSGCRTVVPQCSLNVGNHFGKLTMLFPEKFLVQLQSKDNFAANAQIQGRPSSTPEGTIQIHLENNFGAVIIRYI